MVIIMNIDATAEDINGVIEAIESAGLTAKVMEGSQQKIVGVIGDKTRLASMPIDALPGVEKSVEISKSYKLASREFHPVSSVIARRWSWPGPVPWNPRNSCLRLLIS